MAGLFFFGDPGVLFEVCYFLQGFFFFFKYVLCFVSALKSQTVELFEIFIKSDQKTMI